MAAAAGPNPQPSRAPLVVAGNNGHAYTFTQYYCEQNFSAFYRDSFGAMNTAQPHHHVPAAQRRRVFPQRDGLRQPERAHEHMAVAIHEDFLDCGNNPSPLALAAYTVDYNGNLIYNGAMLKLAINAESMAINPQGNLLAVSAATSNPFSTKDGPGLQVFHFNGGNPITGLPYQRPHQQRRLGQEQSPYATSRATNKLYVFTITPTSIQPVCWITLHPQWPQHPCGATVVAKDWPRVHGRDKDDEHWIISHRLHPSPLPHGTSPDVSHTFLASVADEHSST